MQKFKNKLGHIAGGSVVTMAVLLALALALAIVGTVQLAAPLNAFDPVGAAGQYSELVVTYVMGPFAEQTQNDRTSDEYYIAEDAEGYWYLVDLKPHHTLPVYGEDVFDEDIAGLPGITLRGTSRAVDPEMVPYLVDFVGSGLTAYNYDQYFGDVYLDATNGALPTDKAMVWFLFAGVLALITVLLAVPTLRSRSKLKAILDTMEQDGTLQPLYEDFSIGTPLYCDALKLAVSAHYALDASDLKQGLRVLRLAEYTNAYRCNMLDGDPTTTYYIALETAEGDRTGIGFCANGAKQVERLVPKVRAGLRQKEVS